MVTDSRTIAVGDIHGCAKTFRRLMFEVVRLQKTDSLYLLGDMIDRGPDSKGVIETIFELQSSGYDIRPILGNHEQMLLTAVKTAHFTDRVLWLFNGGAQTLESYGVTEPEELGELVPYLKTLPLYRMTDSHIFVHAGLDFSLEDPFSDEEAMLWKRGKDVDEAKLHGRVVVSGHTPVQLSQIRRLVGTSHIQLDNGCVQCGPLPDFGNLVALELESGVLHVQENIE